MRILLRLFLVIGCSALMLGCGDEDDPMEDNTAPIIDKFTIPETVEIGTESTFNVIAHDADGDELTYIWTVNGEAMSDTTATATWTPASIGIVTVEVYVSDGMNQPVTQSGIITVDTSEPPPEVVSVSVVEGQVLPANAVISVTFSINMASIEIAVSGTPGTTIASERTATWIPTGEMSEGPHTLTISGTDKFGRDLVGFTPINFEAVVVDVVPPQIDDPSCDPRNWADGVDPQDYSDGEFIIAFIEEMSRVDVVAAEPDFPFVSFLSDDGQSLTIIALGGYTLPYETEFTFELDGEDLAGNALMDAEYGFITMAKE